MKHAKLYFMVMLAVLFFCGPVFSGPLNPSSGKGNYKTYTLGNIYNRLEYGTDASEDVFMQPSSGPITNTGHDLNAIMAAAPKSDDTNGVSRSDVISGKTFWGLKNADGWGKQTGEMNVIDSITEASDDSHVFPAGYYSNRFNLQDIDTDLISNNIRGGVVIFGVYGSNSPIESKFLAPVAQTGQKADCYWSASKFSECSRDFFNGQDARDQAGVAWPNPRFKDNGNGTVTDNLTGLVWLKNANCKATTSDKGLMYWPAAIGFASKLGTGECGLSGNSRPGEWRLPNIKELQSLVDYGEKAPALPEGHPFSGVETNYFYWSSTGYLYFHNVYALDFDDGVISLPRKDGNRATGEIGYAWAVRDPD